jgi:hypothetical protein
MSNATLDITTTPEGRVAPGANLDLWLGVAYDSFDEIWVVEFAPKAIGGH